MMSASEGDRENQTNADKGGGGQKTRKFCRHHISMAPMGDHGGRAPGLG